MGIIPALAGNTAAADPRSHMGPDHPRSRGEYSLSTWLTETWMGSSPLSRGIHGRIGSPEPLFGIIPALAGNTMPVASPDDFVLGSSPLSRGIPMCGASSFHRSRIIPALAGNTSRVNSATFCAADHPRSRGEYPCSRLRRLTGEGSSPLSRGIHPTGSYG